MGKISKVVICGMKGVGKTTILQQLIYGNVTSATKFYSTIEDIYLANIETDRGTKEMLFFYDTAGLVLPLNENSQSFQGLPKHYMAFADGYILVYDTCKPESLNLLMLLHKDIEKNKDKKDAPIIVIGNRTGPPDPALQENTSSKASNWCQRERLRYWEVDALERVSLYEGFVFLSTRLNPAPTKSSFPQLPTLTKLTQKGFSRADS